MEDWEQFFVEKSRRRADKDRAERRRRRNGRRLVAAIIALSILFGIVGLMMRSSSFALG